jgi:peptide/nickel transport system permease protein
MGAGPVDIMVRTIAPNVIGPLIVQVGVTASVAVLATAALSFLGLGAPPPAPSWGAMLQISRSYLYQAPLYGFFPGWLWR